MGHRELGLLVEQFGCFGARAGGEHEGEGARELGCGRHLEGLLEVIVGLAREPDDDVGGHGQAGNGRPGLCELFEEALARVAPMHQLEDAVGSGLQREVQVFTDLRRLGHGLEGLGAHVLGVRRGVADPVHTLDCSDVAE